MILNGGRGDPSTLEVQKATLASVVYEIRMQ